MTIPSNKEIYLRPAHMDDAAIMYDWQVVPETRRFYRNTEVPDPQEHKRWLIEKLTSTDDELTIIMENGEPAGVLRLDKRDCESYEVSIMIAPKRQGQGVASAALASARRLRPAAAFHAEVLQGNEASRALFKGAGYVCESGKENEVYVSRPGCGASVIALYSDGGPDIGLGHVRRCLGLASELQKKGMVPVFLIPPDSGLEDLIELDGFPYGVCAPEATALNRAVNGAKMLIVDSYRVNIGALVSTNSPHRLLAAFDDMCEEALPVDLVINGSPAALGLEYNNSGAKKLLLGAHYQIVRSDMGAPTVKKHPPKRLLITFGGGLSVAAQTVLDLVIDNYIVRWPELEIDFVFGPIAVASERILPKGVTVHYGPKNWPQLVARADLAICGGGQTMFELMRVGVPTIALGLADNQVPNLSAVQEKNIILYAGSIKNADWIDRLNEYLENIMVDSELYANLAAAGPRLIDGGGGRHIAEVVCELVQGKTQ